MTFFDKRFSDVFRTSIIFLVFFEVISLIGFLLPSFGLQAFVIALLLAAAYTFVRFELAMLLLLAELCIGSQGGYLLSFPGASGIDFSLRMGLFIVVFGAWIAKTLSSAVSKDVSHRVSAWQWLRVMRERGILFPYVALLGVFAIGAVNGLMRGNAFSNVFFDANGYVFFLLLPPFIAAFDHERIRKDAIAVLSASVVVSLAKALFVLHMFSHRLFFFAQYIYVWVRDTRVGEITRMQGDFYRVFFQSHVFAVVLLFVVGVFLVSRSWRERGIRPLLLLGGACWTAVIMGFSRSFWFGMIGATAVGTGLLYWKKAPAIVWKRAVAFGIGGVFVASLVIFSTYVFPFPGKGGSASFTSLLSERAFSLSGEAAANSRWALLPVLWEADTRHPLIGSGLGTTVTYKTSDPRLLADNPTGEYSTFAFEWGYHDLWLKFGLLGLLVYGWFLFAIIRPLFAAIRHGNPCKSDDESATLAMGLFLAVIALLTTNVFSPYLNHPLGIGLFMLVAAFGTNEGSLRQVGVLSSSIAPKKS